MIFVGLSFKLAAAPFHMWAPDVYQGAPTPVTAFLSVVSKTAGFVIMIRIFLSVFGNAASRPEFMRHFAEDARLYCLYCRGDDDHRKRGRVKTTNIKRMFAYSSIAHAGYILVAFASFSSFMLILCGSI